MFTQASRSFMIAVFATWLLMPATVLAQEGPLYEGFDEEPPPPPPCGEAVRVRSNYANLHIYPSSIDQAEVSIAVDPANPQQLLAGAMTVPFNPYWIYQGYYHTDDGGLLWSGSDTLPPEDWQTSDPSVAYDADGRAYYAYLQLFGPSANLRITRSPDGGKSWPEDRHLVEEYGYRPDKPHLAIDVVSENHTGNIYLAWTTFAGYPPYSHSSIGFAHSDSAFWPAFSPPFSISEGSVQGAGLAQGVNLGVAPDGRIYATWAVYDDDGDVVEDAIGFNRSADGGDNWWADGNRIVEIEGIRVTSGDDPLPPKELRAFSHPAMAVDTVGGGRDTIYMVWADRRYGGPYQGGDPDYKDSDILLIKSVDGGDTWMWTDPPVRVNQDPVANGQDQWFPWITLTGHDTVFVVFYDCRNDLVRDGKVNYMTETWVARSTDGGQSFEDFRVSDVAFEPCLINSDKQFIGDYIGITSTADYVYACWPDNRFRQEGADRGTYQVQVGVIPLHIDTISGTIASNTEWDWTVVLDGDVTVAPGATLKIKPSAKIIIEPNGGNPVNIDVYGTLEILDGGRPHFFSDSTAGA